MSKTESITLPLLDRIGGRIGHAHVDKDYAPIVVALLQHGRTGELLLTYPGMGPQLWSFPENGASFGRPVNVTLSQGVYLETGLEPASFSLDAYLGEADVPYGRRSFTEFSKGERLFLFALTCTEPEKVPAPARPADCYRWSDIGRLDRELVGLSPQKRETLLQMAYKL